MSMDYGFLGERDSEEQVSLVLVIRERRHKMTWEVLVPRKGTEFTWIREESSEVHRPAQARQARSGATMSRRLKRWEGKSDKPRC